MPCVNEHVVGTLTLTCTWSVVGGYPVMGSGGHGADPTGYPCTPSGLLYHCQTPLSGYCTTVRHHCPATVPPCTPHRLLYHRVHHTGYCTHCTHCNTAPATVPTVTLHRLLYHRVHPPPATTPGLSSLRFRRSEDWRSVRSSRRSWE